MVKSVYKHPYPKPPEPKSLMPFQWDDEYKKELALFRMAPGFSPEEMQEMKGVPYYLLNTMYPNVDMWGHNAAKITEIFDTLAECNSIMRLDSLSTDIVKPWAAESWGGHRALINAMNSISEASNFKKSWPGRLLFSKALGTPIIGTGTEHGYRYNRLHLLLDKGLYNFCESTVVHEAKHIKLVIKAAVIALSCEDRLADHKSGFTQADYDVLMSGWVELQSLQQKLAQYA